MRVLPRGQQFYRPLEHDKLLHLRDTHWDWDSHCPLSLESERCLFWWLYHIPGASSPLHKTSPDMTLQTDSSSYAWGSYLNGKTAQGRFSEHEMPLSINTKETLAIWYSLRSFHSELTCQHLLIQSDNTTAVSYVQHMGGIKSDLRNRISGDIWNLADDLNIELSVAFLPGRFNGDADLASRFINYRTEWCLPKKYFKSLCDHFQFSPTIDLFASRLNTRLPRYMAFAPDPDCVHMDCFTSSWCNEKLYIFAPFNLIHRTLQCIQRDQCTALIVFPLWPTQPWFSSLLQLLARNPVLLPKKCELFLPWDCHHRHPLPNLRLCSAVLYGNASERRAIQCHHAWPSSNHGTWQPRKDTLPISPNGYSFALRGKWIQCDQLPPT